MIPIFLSQLPNIVLFQLGPPGVPDPTGGGRYPPSDKFDSPFDSAPFLSLYVSVSLLQCNDIFMRVKKWQLSGQCQLNLIEQPEPFVEFPEENQLLTFAWEDQTEVADEIHLLESYPVRPGFYAGGVQPWRGYSSFAPDTISHDPDKVTLAISSVGDTGSTGPGPYFNSTNGDGDLRFAEFAYADGVDTWTPGQPGLVSCDFRLRTALWQSSGLINTYTIATPTDIKCFSTDATDLVIVGQIGSQTLGQATPVLGIRDGYSYNWILKPTEYWSWDGTYNTSTGALI